LFWPFAWLFTPLPVVYHPLSSLPHWQPRSLSPFILCWPHWLFSCLPSSCPYCLHCLENITILKSSAIIRV
jgi:hypothetical protein